MPGLVLVKLTAVCGKCTCYLRKLSETINNMMQIQYKRICNLVKRRRLSMKTMNDGELLGSDVQTYTNGGLSPVMTKEETHAREKDMKATSRESDSDRTIKQAVWGL